MSRIVSLLVGGFLLRVVLAVFLPHSIKDLLQTRMEFSTPVSSATAVKECLFLLQHGFPSLYEGGSCHLQPVLVHALDFYLSFVRQLRLQLFPSSASQSYSAYFAGDFDLYLLYSLVDVGIAFILYRICRLDVSMHRLFSPTFNNIDFNSSKSSSSTTDSQSSIDTYGLQLERLFRMHVLDLEYLTPVSAVVLYLFNPLTILCFLSLSPSILSNVSIALSILAVLRGYSIGGGLYLAFACYLAVYPAILVPAMTLLVYRANHTGHKLGNITSLLRCMHFGFGVSLGIAVLLGGSFMLVSDLGDHWREDLAAVLADPGLLLDAHTRKSLALKYINIDMVRNYFANTYGVILTISDLSINIGPYWYLFIEIFDEFRSFFVAVVQMHMLSFTIPVTIKFRQDPLFAIYLLYGSSALLKSYPSLPDFSFWFFFLMPMQKKLFTYFRNSLVSFSGVLFSLILLPSFHYSWVYLGSGNSNFCYAVTLVFAMGITLIISDSVYAWLRRAYDIGIVHGAVRGKKDHNGISYRSWVGVDVTLR